MALFGRSSPAEEAREARWRAWLRAQDPLAVASFVLGVFSLTHLGILLVDALASVVMGGVALARAGARPASGVRWLAGVGILAAVVSLTLAYALYTHEPG